MLMTHMWAEQALFAILISTCDMASTLDIPGAKWITPPPHFTYFQKDYLSTVRSCIGSHCIDLDLAGVAKARTRRT